MRKSRSKKYNLKTKVRFRECMTFEAVRYIINAGFDPAGRYYGWSYPSVWYKRLLRFKEGVFQLLSGVCAWAYRERTIRSTEAKMNRVAYLGSLQVSF